MSAPNIVNVTTITGKTVGSSLGTSITDIVVNSLGSGKVFKINAIYVSNVNGSASAQADVAFYDNSSSALYRIGKAITIPANSVLDVLSKSIYLEEGDKIQALSGTANYLEIIISYEEIS